jgi:RNA polymerase sigma-70 factor (ECF subfamily)
LPQKNNKHNNLETQKEFSKRDFEAIYEAYHKKVLNFVVKRVSLKETAEDLTSEIFEKIYKSIDDFQWQGITISAWIFRIARNRIIDYYRKNSKRKNDASIDDYSNTIVSSMKDSEDMMIESEEYTALYNSIREFNESDQYLIYYKFFEQLSNSDIAKLLNLSETNVGTKLHRIRKKLVKFIKKESSKKVW